MFIHPVLFLLALFATVAVTQSASSPYAPTLVQCPKDVRIRPAHNGLSPQEKQWREKRLGHVVKALSSYLNTANIPNYKPGGYLSKMNVSTAPVVGMAISGGGSQSGMGGLGLWQAFDDRYPPAVKAGTGGLVQCLSYLTGLSGGGLTTVLPLASHNFSSLENVRDNANLTADYLVGPGGNQTAHFEAAFKNAYVKYLAGFSVSATDIFGQFYRQYLPASWGYKGLSDVANPNTSFSQGLAPMPIVLLSEVVPGSSPEVGGIMYPGVNSSNLTMYEQTPFEFGSWVGGRVQGFMPTKFLGTAMNNGTPASSNHCVNGFDKVTFAQGSTGNAWNFWFIDAFYNIPLFYKRDRVSSPPQKRSTLAGAPSVPIPQSQSDNPQVILVNETATVFNQTFNESMWGIYPNPFNNYNKKMQGEAELLIVDGSETGETIPLRSLVVPQRSVDFILAFDSSGEEPGNNWVNGTTFGMSAAASKLNGIPFPEVPDPATFVNLGLNRYPTFFGCNASASTPLILYIPNAPWSAYSNYSYTVSSFTDNQLDLVFNNSLNTVTFGLGKLDGVRSAGKNNTTPPPPFPACIACGLIYKSLLRVGEMIPPACQACFTAHCWNGTTADTPATPVYDPGLLLEPGVGYEEWNATVWT
ncbi:uncharacterized protein Z520_00815 [Fonsecaea multimorphosa CBS 102226]|uniref:Lysophospholipase n=1 Tax=Fonsecaea multimorphosa CBS 102226 TaxID=1442371 RepID=A0A0D2KDC0_9EURO|nr:uncharacterized protein Z520_00815 [Fonsecaea multimorphosa CBS 102226]KIY04123.1 hypothetical protein Z520_00815 [Fonsecaea multimorphosa CBS 102226]OAL31954.1 hypothetical protein AYO22_00824 [Fonsecaea multimorphosa]